MVSWYGKRNVNTFRQSGGRVSEDKWPKRIEGMWELGV